MRRVFVQLSLTAGVACAATAAHADSSGFYVGAGITRAKVDNVFESGQGFDIDNTSWKAIVGLRALPVLAVEANYLDLGSETRSFGFGGAHADGKAFAAFAVGFLPIPVPMLDVYGKIGLARWQLGASASPSLFALEERGTDFAWGGGAQVHFGNVGVRLEYEQFDIHHTDGARIFTLGATFNIL